MRAAMRWVLLPGELLDAAQPLPTRCRPLPVAVRRAGRALLPSKSRRGRRADGFGHQSAALYYPEDGVALPEGVCTGLLVQGGGVPAIDGWRQESRDADQARLHAAQRAIGLPNGAA